MTADCHPLQVSTMETKLAAVAYPRTGKRGVPQQFPRRLYEMLESETKLEATPGHQKVIFWSDSGKAFRIVDVSLFAATVLPRYFRTKKFSSFQRNLNLYGFSKVRRGPETDMYAHPSFVRNQPETLSHLRKSTPASSRRRSREPSSDGSDFQVESRQISRAVSPSPPRFIEIQQIEIQQPTLVHINTDIPKSSVWQHGPSFDSTEQKKILQTPSFGSKNDRGRLDLLAYALEQEAFIGTKVWT